MGMVGNLMGGGGRGGGPMPANSGQSRPQARTAPSRRPDMDGPGDIDALLKELDQSSVGTANQARGVSLGRGDTRVSVERSDANTLILNV